MSQPQKYWKPALPQDLKRAVMDYGMQRFMDESRPAVLAEMLLRAAITRALAQKQYAAKAPAEKKLAKNGKGRRAA